jgi:hypothetical protein
MVDVERHLRDYGTELDSALDPVTADEIYRRAEGLDVAVLPPPRLRWTPLRVVLAAAAIALLLFLPILLLRDSTEPPVVDDPVTTTVAVTSTSVPVTTTPSVAGAEDVFLSETSLGTIEWTRVESDRRINPIASSDGLIQAVEEDSDYNVVGYLQSNDGITWEPTTEPEISPWSYVSVGEETLATVSSGGLGGAFGSSSRRVFHRSWDGDPEADAALFRQQASEWVQVPLPPTRPGPVPGLEIQGPSFQGVAGRDGSNWVAALGYLVQVPWGDVYAGESWPIWNESLQLLEIFPPSDLSFPPASEPLATLKVEVVGSTIEFRDAETGELVHTVEATLPGWTPEELLAGLRGWGLFDVSFVVCRDGELSVVRPPWPMSEEWIENGVVESSGRYYTHTLTPAENYTASAIHLWESADGLNWNKVDLPQLHDGPIDYVTLSGSGDRLFMVVDLMGGPETVWTSTDARDWQEVDAQGIPFIQTERTEFGWLSSFSGIAISGDGLAWERVDLPGNPAEPSVIYLDGLFFLGPTRDTAPFVTWVGRFVD